MFICRGTEQRLTSREYEETYFAGGLYMYMYVCMHAGVLSQLARLSVGLVLVASVPQSRLMPRGFA
jgi:hypothetical protein